MFSKVSLLGSYGNCQYQHDPESKIQPLEICWLCFSFSQLPWLQKCPGMSHLRLDEGIYKCCLRRPQKSEKFCSMGSPGWSHDFSRPKQMTRAAYISAEEKIVDVWRDAIVVSCCCEIPQWPKKWLLCWSSLQIFPVEREKNSLKLSLHIMARIQ